MSLLLCCLLLLTAGEIAARNLFPETEKETRVGAAEAREYKIFRGEYLRTAVVRVEVMDLYDCQLARNTCPALGILIHRKQHQIFYEAKVYQAVQRIDKEHEDDTLALPEYYPLKNRVIYGKETSRDNIQELGVWKNEPFRINGHQVRTNAEGKIIDENGMIFGVWNYFDLLENRRYRLKISHEKMGEQDLELYRIIPRRNNFDQRNLDEDIRNDILWANNIDFSLMTTDPERKNLIVSTEYSDALKPGRLWKIAVTVENKGKAQTCCLLGRIFSSEKWLNGRLFYFGKIASGEKKTFCRYLQLPENLTSETVFADLVFCDSWNPLQQLRRKMRLKCVP